MAMIVVAKGVPAHTACIYRVFRGKVRLTGQSY